MRKMVYLHMFVLSRKKRRGYRLVLFTQHNAETEKVKAGTEQEFMPDCLFKKRHARAANRKQSSLM